MTIKPVQFSRDIHAAVPSLQVPEFEVDPDDSLHDQVVTALRAIYDPEISVNIYDLGLIYDLDIDADGKAHIKMTLTTAACPVAGSLPALVESTVNSIAGISATDVELVWDPPWCRDMMSDEARLNLGLL